MTRRDRSVPEGAAAQTAARTVVEAVLERAEHARDSVALVCEGRNVSFGELARRVGRLAAALRRRGVGPEVVVAVALAQDEELVLCVLAVLRAGGAYLPLEREHPAGRQREILRASGAALLISDEGDFESEVGTVTPAALDAEGDARGGTLPLPASRQLAYVIYTSGSTGAPKGVSVEHGSLLNHMHWMAARWGDDAGRRVLQRTSPAFDASVWELFLSPLVGGTLVMVGGADHRDPAVLAEILAREHPTALQCVPTFLRFALERGAFDAAALRVVFVGGEALDRETARAFMARSAARLINLYGPTEATVDATSFEVDRRWDAGPTCPIGAPIEGVRAWLMSPDLAVLDDGAHGELWLGGAGVGRGYHRAPAATAAAFVPDPCADQGGQRAYRTGDLVRRADGVLWFVGRADRLLKLHGFRIEPAEIESALRQHAAVRDALVRVHAADGARVLIAYCLPAGEADGEADGEAVRAHLARTLPRYMVPARIVWLDRFPVKPNGKLDLAALPAPEARPTGAAPHDPTEEALADIWSRLFKRPVGVGDNFFEIGGDSIRSLQVISLAKERGLALRLQDIFECPTIRALAPRVTPAAGAREDAGAFRLLPAADRERLEAAGFEDGYPTTVLLDALYLLSETSGRYEVYVTSCEVIEPWRPEALRAALERVVRRHAWLRTSFAYEGFSRPLQRVHRQVPVAWGYDDLRGLAREEQERRLAAWMEREKRNEFDWSAAPVWRVTIHERGADRFQLTLSEPIFDGWSVSSLLGELLAEYHAAANGTPGAARRRPRASYRDFVAAEQESLRDPNCAAFWQGKLQANLGRALPRPAGRRADSGVRRTELRLSRSASERLREIGRQASAPLKSVLLAVHARVLADLTGAARVVSGVIMNGRSEEAEAEQVLGLHINTVPLVLNLARPRNWRELIQEAFAAEKEALPYRRYPLAAIQKLYGRGPLFDAAFNFTHFHGLAEALRAGGVAVGRYVAWDQTFFPFTAQFHVDLGDQTLGLGLDYDSADFDSAWVEGVADLYREALERVAAGPDAPFKRALRAPARRPPASAAGAGADVWERFRDVARLRPDRVALVSGDSQLSYAALAGAASALAARLDASGAARGSVVVACATQYEAAVALLALLEAGGVYLPVDPAFPDERIQRIARDAGASLCLCDAEQAARLCGLGLRVEVVDVAALARTGSATRPRRAPGPAAYRIYTSGSTGEPKGVEIGAPALAHVVAAMTEVAEAGPDEVVPGITTIAFDISLLEMLLPLTLGARLVALEREVCRDGERLAAALATAEASLCQATPTTWRLLLEGSRRLPRGLRGLVGGEALPADLAARLLAEGLRVTNVYGPTETTIWSAAGAVRENRPITLGRPIGAMDVRAVGAFQDEAETGAPGEIWIGGPALAHGYVGRPALTAARFVPDPFGAGLRCYRTGDVARRGAHGELEFIGRLDDQVKVRGYRIELGEIESALARCPGVRAAAAKVAGQETPVIAGYVVLEPGAAWDEEQARRRLARWLPEHMLPRRIVRLDALPLTPNGKLDRARLPVAAVHGARRVLELFERVKRMNAEDVRRELSAQG